MNEKERTELRQLLRCPNYMRTLKQSQPNASSVPSDNMGDHQLNKTLVSQLKCASCPRTVFPPITGCLRDHVVCSYCLPSIQKCPQPCSELLIEKPLLNSLARCLQYQCFYACGNYFSAGDIALHESTCIYCPTECPAVDCDVLINIRDVKAHFINKHKDKLIIKNVGDVKCKVSFTNNPYDVLLVLEEGKTAFWIFTYFENGFTEVIVQRITGNNKDKFVIEYKNDFVDVKAFGRIFKPDEEHLHYQNDRSCFVKIPLECLDPFTQIFISFDLEQIASNSENILKNIVANLECPICLKGMKAPIFMCSKGHSICGPCKNVIYSCPICRSNFVMQPPRNYALESILEICRNENLIPID